MIPRHDLEIIKTFHVHYCEATQNGSDARKLHCCVGNYRVLLQYGNFVSLFLHLYLKVPIAHPILHYWNYR